jgi:AIPR protein
MTYNIPISQDYVRSFKDPNKPKKVRILHGLVRVGDLPQDIPLDPDPRAPKIEGPVTKRIVNSLRTNDGRFHLLNRGITISAKEVDFDNKHGILKLNIPDNETYGVIDGGHTYRAITSVVTPRVAESKENNQEDDQPPLAEQFVHLEVLVGIESHLADIAEARNFSVSLKAWTLAGYRDKFEWFLTALGSDYSQYVKISENDEQPVGILDLIQVMCAVNPTLYPASVAPVEAYKNAGKCLQYFIEPNDRHGFRKLEKISPDIVRLYDYVRFHWRDAYNTEDETGRRGRLGARAVMRQRKRNRAAMATYYFLKPGEAPTTGENLPVEKGFAIPVISSFRALLEEKQGGYRWYSSPFAFFDKYGPKLVKLVMTSSDSAGNDPHVVGRDPQIYTALYSEVRRWYLEGKVAKLESQAVR